MPSHRMHPPPRPMSARAKRLAGNLAAAIEAGAVLAVASVAIRCLPFPRLLAAAGWRGRGGRPDDAAATARRIRWATDRVADVAPWRAVCFQRGLAAHWMLRRRGIPSFLHYGIDGRAPGGMSAHVWVTLDGEALLGGADAARHARVLTRPDPEAR